jgi:hypothetical protein
MAVWLSCWQPALLEASQQTGALSQLTVTIVEGQGAINNVRSRASAEMVVLVEDEKQQPVPGASVAFTLPSQGPSGAFVNGEKTLVITTDSLGKAVARGLTPTKTEGKMEIRVTASHQGKTASATITQFNMAVQNQKNGGNGKWIAILVAAGAAGATGAVLATRGGSSPGPSPTPTPPPVITISPGSGSVGAPQ